MLVYRSVREPPYFSVATKSGHIGNLGCSKNNRNWPLQISWPFQLVPRRLTLGLNIHFWDEYIHFWDEYLEPINTSKPRPFWSKTNVISIYLVESLNSAQIIRGWLGYAFKKNGNVHPLWTTHDAWPNFGGEEKHHSSQKSNQKSNKAITVWPLPIWSCPKKHTPFFSWTKALDRTEVFPYILLQLAGCFSDFSKCSKGPVP